MGHPEYNYKDKGKESKTITLHIKEMKKLKYLTTTKVSLKRHNIEALQIRKLSNIVML